MRRRRIHAAVALVVLLLLSACNDDAAKALRDAAAANDTVQKFAIDANAKGLMTKAETTAVVEATVKIAESGKVAVAVLRTLQENDPASKTKSIDAIGLVADQLGQLLKTMKISNDTARREIEAGLLLVQTSVNTARVIVAASK